MFPRKEIRLFVFIVAVLALGIGVRAICVMRLNRYSPQWVRPSNAHVAQAASLPTATANTTQGESVTGTQATQDHGEIAASVTTTIDSAVELDGVQVPAVEQKPQGEPYTGASGTQVDAHQPASDSTSPITNALHPEISCTNPDGSKRMNINTATAAELDTLPGIGPAYAAAILQERAQRGQFTSIRQLLDVRGIGPARFAKLEPLVCVGYVPERP
ncbi:MAG TPA: helix-hairpin-helix domain-containing protein [Firmicutes bacterium]|nr:helix-hairpin-helix domain-containing protein [Bacillota bacterium]